MQLLCHLCDLPSILRKHDQGFADLGSLIVQSCLLCSTPSYLIGSHQWRDINDRQAS